MRYIRYIKDYSNEAEPDGKLKSIVGAQSDEAGGGAETRPRDWDCGFVRLTKVTFR
jgi:hypothetical protein